MKHIVLDTCVLYSLHKGNVFHLLKDVFDKIYLPQAVFDECLCDNLQQSLIPPPLKSNLFRLFSFHL